MSQFIKLNSRQGVITAQNNLVDFDIPADGVYDLTKSYVNIMCSIDVNQLDLNGDVVDNPTPNPYKIVYTNENDVELYNVALVKNYEFRNKVDGTLEYVRDVNVLQQNMNEYTLTEEEKNSIEYRQINSAISRSNVVGGLNVEVYGEGSTLSRNVVFPVKIPLSQLGSMGNMKQYPAKDKGETRIHLELALDKLECEPIYTNTDAEGLGVDFPVNNFNEFDDITATADDTAVNQVLITNIPKSKGDNPYFVGQKLIFIYNVDAGQAQSKTLDVEQIEFVNSDNTANPQAGDLGKIRLTLSDTIATLANAETLSGTITYCKYNNSTLEVDRAELVLHKYNQDPEPVGPVAFRTFTTENFNAGNVSVFKHIFECEPNAVNLLVLQPKNNTITSSNEEQLNYRISVDNIPTTDRKVLIKSPLYYDKQVQGFTNMGKPLKNLLELTKTTQAQVNNFLGDDVDTLLISEPLPLTENYKLVQLEFETDGVDGVKELNLYKQVLKEMK